jgi:hypothetical protein
MGLLIRTALVMAGNLGFAGFVMGAISGILAVWLGDDLSSTVLVVSRGYWGLAVLFPIALWFAHLILPDFDEKTAFPGESRLLYLSWPVAVLTSWVGTALGVFLGGVPFFLVFGANLPILFGGQDADALYAALSAHIFWGQFTWIAAVALLTALPMAFWVHQIAKERV